MKTLFLLVIGILFSSLSVAQKEAHKIAVGDTVSIQVVGEPELSVQLELNESGVYNYPFLGEVELLGKTIFQVQSMVTNGLKGDYLVDPQVNVNVRPRREEELVVELLEGVYVNGEVSRSGQFPYSKGLTVGKAIVLAGGFTDRAAKTRIRLFSEEVSDKEFRVDLDYQVKPGDIITVPRRFF